MDKYLIDVITNAFDGIRKTKQERKEKKFGSSYLLNFLLDIGFDIQIIKMNLDNEIETQRCQLTFQAKVS